MSDADPDRWWSWWWSLTPQQRTEHRDRNLQSFDTWTHDMTYDAHHDPYGMERTYVGSGAFDLPPYLLDAPEPTKESPDD
jgi:hypothetical protein